MKSIVSLLLVLLFASCGKQDVYEFEEEKTAITYYASYPVKYKSKVKVRFKLIEEDNICIFEIDRNSSCEFTGEENIDGKKGYPKNLRIYSRIGLLEFRDKDDFVLFETFASEGEEFFNVNDAKEFRREKKTRYVSRSLLEEVESIEFNTSINRYWN